MPISTEQLLHHELSEPEWQEDCDKPGEFLFAVPEGAGRLAVGRKELVNLVVGGLRPNGIALESDCWPEASRPLVSRARMAALHAGKHANDPITAIQ